MQDRIHTLTSRIAVVVALSVALPGCSSIMGMRLFAHASPHHDRAPGRSVAAIAFTDEGRKHLDAGETDKAIQAFQLALAASEPQAPAYNGLGVAYARLERGDQARHYFEMAIALAPDDQRFMANLDRLRQSSAYAEANAPVVTAVAELPPVAASRATDQPTIAASVKSVLDLAQAAPVSRGRLHREGRNEFFIRTVDPMAAPMQTAALSVDRRFKPLVRFEIQSQATPAATTGAADKPRSPSLTNFKPVIRFALPPTKD
jgi:tetratricopeptide (TPR) repeat protein